MYTATQGASVSRFVVKSSPSLSDGLMTLNIQMHISWRAEKQATSWVNRRVNTLNNRVPNHATVRIRQMQEDGQDNA